MFLYRSGAAIRAYTINSMKRKKDKNIHAPIGKPPFAHLKKSEFLKGAIQFAVQISTAAAGGLSRVLVGAYQPVAGFWGAKHEHGGYYGKDPDTGKKAFFPPRPFMKPAFRRWLRYGLPVIMKDTQRKAFRL
jgi:hypothetical protein